MRKFKSIAIALFLLSLNASAKDYGLKVNTQAPHFETKDLNGKPIKTSDLIRKGPLVLVFYRGGWCPYCNRQLQSLNREVAPYLKKSNGKLLAISVDQAEKARETDKFSDHIIVLSDPKAKILKLYNVSYKLPQETVNKMKSSYDIDIEAASGEKHHTIAIPAVFVIDKKGKIVFSYANEKYKIRAANQDILKSLKSLK